MHIRRGFLFWGVLLIPLGALPLLVRAGMVDSASFDEGWRLWPLVLIGLGLVVIAGRGRAGLVATVVVALTMGLLGGGALASSNGWLGSVTGCVATPTSPSQVTNEGLLVTSATVDLELNCGEADVTMLPGSSWSLNAHYLGAAPAITSSASSLRIASPDEAAAHRQVWQLSLPASQVRDLTITANAASATIDASGSALTSFAATINAGDLRLNGSQASLDRLAISMNAGRARVTLGQGSTTGSLSTNAGSIELCVPAAASLVLHMPELLTFSNNLGQRGLVHEGDTWSRAGTAGTLIELSIEGSVGSFSLDPAGGC